ncbi:MAG: succinylglutamate desuccinylase/aspartoacylase family protein [Bdellovibrionales bacterium]|nr:succinylglutamate desuccinylase/aspartoacylase family protein [Bdellovibrionales bacterium]
MKVFVQSVFTSLVIGFFNVAFAGQPVVSSYVIRNLSDVQVQRIADQFEITRSRAGAYEVMVPVPKRTVFLQLAPSAVLTRADISDEIRRSFKLNRADKTKSGYHSFNEVVQILQATAAANPKLTQLVNYGKSHGGKPLLALRVSNQLQNPAGVKRVVLTAATHGDEIITTEVLLNLMIEFITGATSNPRFAAILSKIEVDFIPVVNPDGFSTQDRYDEGQDPNRSFPWPEKPGATPTTSISGMIAFTQTYPMIGSIDFHAFGELTMYPWAYTRDPVSTSDEKVFAEVTGKMSETNKYTFGQISKVIYVAKGSSADYYYWKYHSLSLGVEIGNSKAPNVNQFPQYIESQRESTWRFLESFTGGKRG